MRDPVLDAVYNRDQNRISDLWHSEKVLNDLADYSPLPPELEKQTRALAAAFKAEQDRIFRTWG